MPWLGAPHEPKCPDGLIVMVATVRDVMGGAKRVLWYGVAIQYPDCKARVLAC